MPSTAMSGPMRLMTAVAVLLLLCGASGAQAASHPPLHASLSKRLHLRSLLRCRGVKGHICSLFWSQQLDHINQPRVHSKQCGGEDGAALEDGSGSSVAGDQGSCGLGVCAGDTGLCDCPAGEP